MLDPERPIRQADIAQHDQDVRLGRWSQPVDATLYPETERWGYGDASRIFSWLQKGARFIGVFASLSEQDGTPAQRAAKTSEFETPAEI